jgi:hypothetical protein
MLTTLGRRSNGALTLLIKNELGSRITSNGRYVGEAAVEMQFGITENVRNLTIQLRLLGLLGCVANWPAKLASHVEKSFGKTTASTLPL